MEIYARVNILGGLSVRLPHGGLDEAIALDNDPIGRAQHWAEQGIDRLHVVDLDAAAYSDNRNRDMIDRMLEEVDIPIQVAGGIRSEMEAERLIGNGAWRIVMGTAAIENQNMVWDLCRENPDKIVVAMDVRHDEEIATRGWTQNSGRYLEEVLIEMSAAGAVAFLIAEAGRDALEEPPNLEILSEALAIVDEPVIAAGGVRNLDDLRDIALLESDGRHIDGVIVGREVTAGRFSISEAKEVASAVSPPPASGEVPTPTIAGAENVAPAGSAPRAPGGVMTTTVSVGVSSLGDAIAFYSEKLGFMPRSGAEEGVATAILETSAGNLVELVEDRSAGQPGRLTIQVGDVARWRDHLTEVGLEPEGGLAYLEITDPDGLVIRITD